MSYFLRLLLLSIAFGLTTMGLMSWQTRAFSFAGIWPLEGALAVHPLHLLILGIAMIPPSLWEIFVLDNRTRNSRR